MKQETGDRRQETGDRRQETGDRSQETGHMNHETRITTVLSFRTPTCWGEESTLIRRDSSLRSEWHKLYLLKSQCVGVKNLHPSEEMPHFVRNDTNFVIQNPNLLGWRIYTHPKTFLTPFGMTQPLSFMHSRRISIFILWKSMPIITISCTYSLIKAKPCYTPGWPMNWLNAFIGIKTQHPIQRLLRQDTNAHTFFILNITFPLNMPLKEKKK